MFKIYQCIYFVLMALLSLSVNAQLDWQPSEYEGISPNVIYHIYQNTFENNNGAWTTRNLNGIERSIGSGYMILGNQNSEIFHLSKNFDFLKNKEIAIEQIEARVKVVKGDKDQFSGISWEDGYNNKYYFGINLVEKEITIYSEKEKFISKKIENLKSKNDYNKLSVRLFDGLVYFFVNNQLVYSIDYASSISNDIGFFVDANTSIHINDLYVSAFNRNFKEIGRPIVKWVEEFEYLNSTTKPTVQLEACIQSDTDLESVKLLVNSESVGRFGENDMKYNAACRFLFVKDIRLKEGENQIQLMVTNKGGLEPITKTIQYNLPNKPIIELEEYVKTQKLVSKAAFGLSACINTETPLSELNIKINDEVIPIGLNALNKSKNCNANLERVINLSPGTNNIIIEATNSGGKSKLPFSIEYQLPDRPAISWENALSNIDVTNDSYINVNACIQSESDIEDVQLYVNGISKKIKTNDIKTKDGCEKYLDKNVELSIGKNEIRVVVINQGGDSELNKTIKQLRVEKPQLSWDNDFKTLNTVKRKMIIADACITSDAEIKEVLITINDDKVIPIALSELDPLAQCPYQLEKSLSLNEGENELKLMARNDGGKSYITKTITYDPPTRPDISWGDKVADLKTVRDDQLIMEACINSSSKLEMVELQVNEITYKIQDTELSEKEDCLYFLSRSIKLEELTNEIIISAINAGGASKITKGIEYIKPDRPSVQWDEKTDQLETTSDLQVEIGACINSVVPLESVELIVNDAKEVIPIDQLESIRGCKYSLSQIIDLDNQRNNIIKLIARNKGGNTKEITEIQHKAIPKPKIISFEPIREGEDDPNVLIEACIASKSKINFAELLIGDQDIDVSTLLISTSECDYFFKKEITLEEGGNRLRLNVANESGNVAERLNLNFTQAEVPKIAWDSYHEDNKLSYDGAYTLKACIDSKIPLDKLTLFVNNQPQTIATNQLEKGTNCAFVLNQNITLEQGENTISLQAKNKTGVTKSTAINVTFEAPEKRIALVVGNADYAKGAALKNPINDARSVAEQLRNLNFDVILEEDLNSTSFTNALKSFERKIKEEEYEVALFYYAGHAMQLEGKNYLIPTNVLMDETTDATRYIKIENVVDADESCIVVKNILRRLEYAGTDLNIVFLDSCRDNPLSRSMSKTRSGATRGLVKDTPPKGTLIAYSTSEGQVAQDGKGKNSPFTTALLEHIDVKGQELIKMLNMVQGSVMEMTGDEQVPDWSSVGFNKDFYFKR